MPPLADLREKAQNFEIKNESEFNIVHTTDIKRVTQYIMRNYFYEQDSMN